MTDHTTDPTDSELSDMDDIELITRLLNGQLDPEHADAVRRRLKEDAAFRELAEPLLLVWSIPPHIERKPRPAGEMERDWAEFVRRTGFGQARPAEARPAPSRPRPKGPWYRSRRWRGWITVVILAFVGTVAIEYREPLGNWLMPYRGFAALPYDTGWIPLGDGVDVQLSPEADLRIALEPLDEMQHVMLVDGTARFRVAPFYPTARAPRRGAIVVRTRAGLVSAGESEFTVTARADTTDVEVHPLTRRGFLKSVEMTVTASAERQDETHHLPLNDLDRARLVRGRSPHRLTDLTDLTDQP